MTWAEQVTAAARKPRGRSSRPATLPSCTLRGETLGERDCKGCGGRNIRLKLFACPVKANGATARDCRACDERSTNPAPAIHIGRPLLGICINSQNEGPRLRATVAAFRDALGKTPHEFIVADDATTDGCCEKLGAGVRVLRNMTRIGCGRSKRRMTHASRARVLTYLDAHLAVVRGDLAAMAETCLASRVVLSPLLVRMSYDAEWNPVFGRSPMAPNDAGLPPNSTKQYRNWHPAGSTDTHMIGVGVTAARETIDALGGWNGFDGWRGSQERGLALRAFMAAVPIHIWPDVLLGHEFPNPKSRPMFPYAATSWRDWATCQWHSWATVLTKDTFARWIQPILMANPKSAPGAGTERTPAVVIEQRAFARYHKRQPDQDLIDMVQAIEAANPVIAPDPGGATLEPAALEIVRREAHGRCLELGAGSGAGTRALLAGADEVVSLEHLPRFYKKLTAEITDSHARFILAPTNSNGFYKLPAFDAPFDLVLMDGPPGTAARRPALDALWPHMAPGWTLLLDDGKRDAALVADWKRSHPIRAELLPTHRGLWKIQAAT